MRRKLKKTDITKKIRQIEGTKTMEKDEMKITRKKLKYQSMQEISGGKILINDNYQKRAKMTSNYVKVGTSSFVKAWASERKMIKHVGQAASAAWGRGGETTHCRPTSHEKKRNGKTKQKQQN